MFRECILHYHRNLITLVKFKSRVKKGAAKAKDAKFGDLKIKIFIKFSVC